VVEEVQVVRVVEAVVQPRKALAVWVALVELDLRALFEAGGWPHER
jgi:hypothetical protein